MRAMRTPLLATATLLLAGCVTSPPVSAPVLVQEGDGLSRARIGETVAVGGPKVTPLSVLEDSRCPKNARCVWAGQVRVRVQAHLGSGTKVLELTQGQPVPLADGTLELVEVQPDRLAGAEARAIAPAEYRFGFRFMGGL
jgi:hypothetical protein